MTIARFSPNGSTSGLATTNPSRSARLAEKPPGTVGGQLGDSARPERHFAALLIDSGVTGRSAPRTPGSRCAAPNLRFDHQTGALEPITVGLHVGVAPVHGRPSNAAKIRLESDGRIFAHDSEQPAAGHEPSGARSMTTDCSGSGRLMSEKKATTASKECGSNAISAMSAHRNRALVTSRRARAICTGRDQHRSPVTTRQLARHRNPTPASEVENPSAGWQAGREPRQPVGVPGALVSEFVSAIGMRGSDHSLHERRSWDPSRELESPCSSVPRQPGRPPRVSVREQRACRRVRSARDRSSPSYSAAVARDLSQAWPVRRRGYATSSPIPRWSDPW